MSPFTGRFSGRAAVLTGGASGLGKAVAQRIAQEWWCDVAATRIEEIDVSAHAAVAREVRLSFQRRTKGRTA